MNNKEIKVYHVAKMGQYSNWIPNRVIVDKIEDADLVIFEGGEDVNPKYYNADKHHTTSYNNNRDQYEIGLYNKAKELGKPCCGICRGSQFLCVMSGGQLVQHQEHPGEKHELTTFDGKTVRVTSSHHQAQLPYDLPQEDYKILGWTKDLLKYHKNGNNDEISPEFECEDVVYYKTNCLGIQSHPEWCFPPNSDSEKEMIAHYQELLTKFLKKEL